MPGEKGLIKRAGSSGRGRRKAVYLSTVFGMWPERDGFHVTTINRQRRVHVSVTKGDGLLYDVLAMLYGHGMRLDPDRDATKGKKT